MKKISEKIVDTKKLIEGENTSQTSSITYVNISNIPEVENEIATETSLSVDPKIFLINETQVNFGKIITSEILIADHKIVEDLKESNLFTGSTAVIAALEGSKLVVANVGDSRAVMSDYNGTAIPLSFDHKPDEENEKNRIEKAGGFVSFVGVWRVNGFLATSRALGDHSLKPSFVIANPDVLEFDLKEHR